MIETPFLTGKQYRDDELGEAAVQRANWRYVAFGALGLSGLLILLVFFLVVLLQRIPIRVIEVDRASGDVQMTQEDWKKFVPPETAYTTQLKKAIIVLRKVTTDKEDMRREHVVVRAQMTVQGKREYEQKIDKERKPFDQKEPVTVDIVGTPLHTGGLTWDVRWRETTYGDRPVIEFWRGLFTFVKGVPQDEEERNATPLGLFLDTWSWSKE